MKKAACLITLSLVFWGCATFSKSYQRGTEAAVNRDWNRAVQYLERAVLEDPQNSVYRLALLRTKLSASRFHWIEGKKLASQGKTEEALEELRQALSFDPSNREIIEDLRVLTGKPEEKVEEPVITRAEPPIKLQVTGEVIDLKFTREASLKSIFQALGKHAGINVLFDEQFKDIPFVINLEGMTFERAVQSLCVATRNFYRPIDSKSIIVVPDQPVKRAQYEIQAIKTFYLSNIKAEEVQAGLTQMLRTQYKAPTIIVDKNLNSLTIRDTADIIETAEKILRTWDKAKGEVVIDLEIMEVSRKKLRQLGIDFDQYGVAFGYSQESSDEGGWLNLSDLDFSKKESYQLILPTSFIRLLETDADTKMISQPRLRGVEGEKIEYLVGDQIPIPRTTFSPIAAGGVSQQPITSFDYKDVGIDVIITPHIHREEEITLEMEMEINSLGGTGFADIPIISTRVVKNIIRLRNGETNLLAGLLKDEERKTLKGVAGFKSIPVVGQLFSSTDQTIQQTDVILTITPYIIRRTPQYEKDSQPIWIGLGESAGLEMPGQRPPSSELDEERLRRDRVFQEPTEERRSEPGKNLLQFNTTRVQIPKEREFRLMVNIRAEDEVSSFSCNLNFNSQILELKEVTMGGFVRQLGKDPSFLQNIDNSAGICTIGFSSPEVGWGVTGEGIIAVLVFVAKEAGEAAISFSQVAGNGPTGESVSFELQECQVIVR
ncbi:MAG: cohesin domain-containing protein [Acidobacteriota bacterium]